jgi:hypothetical protein
LTMLYGIETLLVIAACGLLLAFWMQTDLGVS